jgi:hypothetical protein
MKWLRRNIRTGSRLALFALALQLVLSFGHFHWDTAQAAAAAQSQADFAQQQASVPDVVRQAQQPAGHDDGKPTNDPCAICAVMSMASQMLYASAAFLPLPDAIEQSFFVVDDRFEHLGSTWSAFQSRAPPVS